MSNLKYRIVPMKASEVLGFLKLQTQSSHKAQNGKSSKELPVSLKTDGFCTTFHKKTVSCTPLVHSCLCSCCLRCSSDLNSKTQCSPRNDFSTLFDNEQTIQTHKFIAANIVHYLGHFMDFSFNNFPFQYILENLTAGKLH